MQKLAAVERARSLMTQGQEWSVWRWLLEKRRVREAADRADEALAEADSKVKESWSDDLKKAYAELDSNPKARKQYEKAREEARHVDSRIKQAAQRVKEADDEAEKSRLDAEDMFAEAERGLSAEMARQAARRALESYDLREKAIRKAEAARRA